MRRILVSSAAVASILALLAGASHSHADLRNGAVEVGAFVFRANFDNESNIENNEGFGGRLGILFSENHELEFSLEHVGTEDELFGLEVDLDTFKAGYVYNFIPDSAVSPFITVGGGIQFVEIELFDEDETDPLAFGGGGVRFFIGDVLNIRVDGLVELVFPDDDPDDTLFDGLLQAGVGWVIGGR